MWRYRVVAAVLAVCAGVVAGVGGYTFAYAQGLSYMTNDPAACRNCHVMREQYDAWTRSSHHAVAVCNDCHTPHDFAGKWLTKARNGWHHSVAFTTGRFHEPIFIGPKNLAITEANCRRCHEPIVQQIDRVLSHSGPLLCTRCHRDVGHLH
ncbi:MAG: cytochrome c nitrite reductase small subunit [Armatimonadetes bacterium]|nr:cytochrome c nitrite reductase small subunit [Armatimonadota bacterium]